MTTLDAVMLVRRAVKLIVANRGAGRDFPGDDHIVARIAGGLLPLLEKLLAGARGRYHLVMDDAERFYATQLCCKFARLLVSAWLGNTDHDSVLDLGGYAEKLAQYRRGRKGGDA